MRRLRSRLGLPDAWTIGPILRGTVRAVILVLAMGSLPASADTRDRQKRISFEGDLRVRLNEIYTDAGDGSTAEDGDLQARLRGGLGLKLARDLQAKVRLAGLVSAEESENDYQFKFYTSAPTPGGLAPGQATVDELYIKWTPARKWEVNFGRFQTLFQIKGVLPRTLDRKDSNNMLINWTDGAHVLFRSEGGWTTHLILQRNLSGGATNIRREPLDFGSGDSRISYFLAVESQAVRGPLVQRGLDVSYLPSSLLKDGDAEGRLEDYWGLLGRVSLQWPPGVETASFLLGAEAAHAPETPTEAALQLGTSGDTDGFAWQLSANAMNFKPRHSIGLNYGRAGAGWLLSPQVRNTPELVEVRYRWDRSADRRRFLEIRGAYRAEIDARIGAARRWRQFGGFVRYTHQF